MLDNLVEDFELIVLSRRGDCVCCISLRYSWCFVRDTLLLYVCSLCQWQIRSFSACWVHRKVLICKSSVFPCKRTISRPISMHFRESSLACLHMWCLASAYSVTIKTTGDAIIRCITSRRTSSQVLPCCQRGTNIHQFLRNPSQVKRRTKPHRSLHLQPALTYIIRSALDETPAAVSCVSLILISYEEVDSHTPIPGVESE